MGRRLFTIYSDLSVLAGAALVVLRLTSPPESVHQLLIGKTARAWVRLHVDCGSLSIVHDMAASTPTDWPISWSERPGPYYEYRLPGLF
jgi:hypothetical protein